MNTQPSPPSLLSFLAAILLVISNLLPAKAQNLSDFFDYREDQKLVDSLDRYHPDMTQEEVGQKMKKYRQKEVEAYYQAYRKSIDQQKGPKNTSNPLHQGQPLNQGVVANSSAWQGQVPDAVEYAALAALYNATGGANWTHNDNWLQGTTYSDFDSWYGVQVYNGDVWQITLYDNNLSGSVPQDFCDLAGLEHLNLSANQITSLPTSIQNLQKLAGLRLWENQLTSLPSEIGTILTLGSIQIADNQLSALPSSISNLNNLIWLDVQGNQLTVFPSGVESLHQLNHLSLGDNQITSLPSSINNLDQLTYLSLRKNQISNLPTEIGDFPLLTNLDVEDNQLTSLPESISNLINLQYLDVKNNDLIELPEGIATLSKLKGLYISSNELQSLPPGIENLPDLIHWWISSNKIVSLPNFKNHPKASSLRLYAAVNHINLNDIAKNLVGANNHNFYGFSYGWQAQTVGEEMTDSISEGLSIDLQAFYNNHPQTRFEWQRWQNADWEGVPGQTQEIYTLSSVTMADSGQYRCKITNDWISGAIQYSEPITLFVEGLDPQTQALHDFVASMTNPNLLPASWDLTDTIASWEGVVIVNGLVTEVVLQEANVQGSIPVTFEDLTGLEILDLTGTGLTGSLPTELGTLTELRQIKLGTNQLSGPIPGSLNSLTQLRELILTNNTLTGPLPELGQLQLLNTLDLESNQLTGDILPTLGTLDSLRTLRLGVNQLDGSIPLELADLPFLEELSLHTNQLTDTIPSALSALDSLRTLDLGNNQLSGDIPIAFDSLLNLEKLYLNDNNLSYLPDFTHHPQADILDFRVEGNQLPLADIAYNHTEENEHPFETFSYHPQQEAIDTVEVIGQVFTVGRDVALRVDLKEHPQHFYQWQKKDQGNWVDVPGANTRSYLISDVTEADLASEFQVVITNLWATLANARSEPLNPGERDFRRYVRVFMPREAMTSAANIDTTTTVAQVQMSTDYLDGMGRSVQSVSRGAGGLASQDIVQFSHYDALGRVESTFLPYATDQATGRYRPDATQDQSLFYQTTGNQVVEDDFPVSVTRYDKSPLSRVLEQGAPGADWQLGGHTATMDYRANTAADAVHSFSITGSNISRSGTYPAGELTVTETTDENGHYVRVFQGKQGQSVLKRVQGPSGTMDTYSVYDERGRLRFVISPQAVTATAGVWTLLNDAAHREQWFFAYNYDAFGRMSDEHVPGGGTTRTIYDRWGRLVYSQTPSLRETDPSQWTYTKYDYLDRPVMSGVFTSSVDESTLRTQVLNTTDRFETRTSSNAIGYTLTGSHPKNVTESTLRTVSYYDNYNFPSAVSSTLDFTDDLGNRTQRSNMKGELTGSLTRNLSNNSWLGSVVYFDEWYRPIVAVSENHLGGIDRTMTKYASLVLDEVLETMTIHSTGSDNDTIRQTYNYDHQSRPTEVTHKVNTESTVTLASYTYNALGQLVQKQLNDNAPSEQATQTINYRYHIRGWLSSINDLNDADAYYAQLNSYQTHGQYNGNIAKMQWKNQGQEAKSYNYSYDPADRLIGATFQKQVSGSWASGNFSVSGITYDGNGNLLTLQRQGEVNNAATTLDHLHYAYQGNRLTSVQEQSAGNAQYGFVDNPTPSGEEYGYDAAGNLLRDDNKGITNITYDPVLNLPLEVSMTNGTLRYTYDAAGIKLSQTSLDSLGNQVRTTHYDGPFEYDGNRLSLIHHGEGRVYYNQDSSHQAYHFDLKDHLGNVRATFSSVPMVLRQMLTMETTAAPEEEMLFDGVADHRQTLAFHNTTEASQLAPSPNKVATLLPGQQGIGKSLRVQAGDKVTLQVEARYETRPTSVQGLEGVVTELAQAAQGTATGLEAVGAVESLNGAALGGALARGKEGRPEAYLNYLVFDENHQLISQGFQPVSDAAAVGPDQPDAAPETLWAEVPIQEAGYLYTYLSNEQGSGMPVFFDDFSVVHQSHIVQGNDYYPFGATHDQEGYVGEHNKYGYQGKELQADLGLNLMDFHARQYDPLLGRFMSYDPAGQFASGYVGMGNNPVMGVDPDGQFVFTAIALGMIINTGVQMMAGNVDGVGDFYLAAGIGAASGAVGFGAGSAVSGALGTIGFTAGALTGSTSGLASGLVGGSGNAWMNGANFGDGLKAGVIAGGTGAAAGGFANGLFGGIGAVRYGGNFWSGKGATFDMTYISGDNPPGKPIKYSNQSARDFSDEYFSKNIKGLNTLNADGSLPKGYTSKGQAVFNRNGKEVLGTTSYLGTGKGADVYLYQKAFVSTERLYLTMGHEYIHVSHFNAGLLNASRGEHAALSWSRDQSKLFNLLPYNKTWANNYLQQKYYHPAYDYSKHTINPLLNFLW